MATVALFCNAMPTFALTTAPQKINFQGRLSDAGGNVVANGLYNMKFALYSAASGGTLKWSETRETTNRVQVTGGLFTVKLGDVAAFTDPTIFSGGALYFEITLANPATATCSTASCQTWESPMNRSELATSAYAFNAELLDGLDSTAFAAATGSTGYIQNQGAIQQAAAGFWMSGTGRADTALHAPLIDTATATTLSLGTTNAISISLNKDVTVAAGRSLTLAGGAYGTRPGSPGEGALYYDTDTDKLLSYANAKWQADRTDAIYVAASNSSQADKDIADYVGNGDTAAAGDGDQIQINDALIAAAGKQVVLLAGTYTADATILVPNNTTLAGVGVSTLIQLADIDVSDNLIENTDQVTGTGVVIRDLNLDGQKALNTVGTQTGIRLVYMGSGIGTTAVRGALVENVNVVSFSGTGIYLTYSNSNVIRGNTVKSTNAGIVLSAASYNTISDNSVHDSNANGIHLQSSSNNNNVTDNQVHAPVGNGINVQSTSNYNAVTGNQITSATAYGIYSTTVGNAISGNSISASGIGIILFTGSSDNSVTGNSVKNSTDDGIYVYNSVRNTVSGNTILNTTDDGIVIDSESHNNTVNSNTIDTTSGAGIVVIGIAGDEPTNNTVTGNSIINTGSSNWNYGIELGYAHKNTIANNRITDDSCSVTCYAISIRVTSATNYITNNTFNSTPGTSTIDNLATSTIYSDQPLAENGANITSRLSNSVAAFQIQNAAGSSLFTVDSTNSRLYVGAVAGDTTGTVLVLGNKTDAGNPTGVDGAMYYNSDSKSFECYKNGLWGDCNFASLRSEWVFQEDFAGGLTTTGNVGDNGWILTAVGSGAVTYTSVGTDASNQSRFGVLQFASTVTNPSGISVRQNAGSMAGVPSNMVVEFDFAPVNASAAAGLQQIHRIGLHNSTGATAPTNGLYFQYVATATAGNWFRCVQALCQDTGVARTTTPNLYQRFKIQTNSAGNSVEFFINETSVGTVSSGLPGATAAYTPAYNTSGTDANIRQWKTDYFQIKRNLTTLR